MYYIIEIMFKFSLSMRGLGLLAVLPWYWS